MIWCLGRSHYTREVESLVDSDDLLGSHVEWRLQALRQISKLHHGWGRLGMLRVILYVQLQACHECHLYSDVPLSISHFEHDHFTIAQTPERLKIGLAKKVEFWMSLLNPHIKPNFRRLKVSTWGLSSIGNSSCHEFSFVSTINSWYFTLHRATLHLKSGQAQ